MNKNEPTLQDQTLNTLVSLGKLLRSPACTLTLDGREAQTVQILLDQLENFLNSVRTGDIVIKLHDEVIEPCD